MGIIANTQLAPDWFTPSSEQEEKQPTRFRLKPLDGEEHLEVMLEVSANASGSLSLNGTGMRLALKFGLVGWENLKDNNGKSVPFSRSNIGTIPVNILSELASEIINRSSVSEGQEKN